MFKIIIIYSFRMIPLEAIKSTGRTLLGLAGALYLINDFLDYLYGKINT